MPAVLRNTAVFAVTLLVLLLGFWALVGFAVGGRADLKTSDLVFGLGVALLVTGAASVGYGAAVSRFGRAVVPSKWLAVAAGGVAFGILFVGVWVGGFAMAMAGSVGGVVGVLLAGAASGAAAFAVARGRR